MTPQELLPLLQRALADHEAGRTDDAEAVYRRVLTEHPDNADALHLMGVLLTQRGRPAEGLPLLHRATLVAPQFAQGHFHLGQTLSELDRHNEALNCYARALQLDPRVALVRTQAGSSLMSLGRLSEALEQFRIASQMEPNNGGFLGNYGFCLYRSGKIPEALQILRQATNMQPVEVPVLLQLGEALWNSQQYEEAAQVAERALQKAPNDIRVLILQGNSYQVLARFEEASAAYRRVLEIDPNNFDAWSNLALTVLKLGKATEALEMYEQVVARWPDRMDALANRSLAILTLGDLSRGFREYETRWRSAAFKDKAPVPGERWDGSQDVAGKTVLLTSEQGAGDVIQFIRYVPMVVARDAKVLVHCSPELRAVIETVQGVSGIHHPGEALPRFDLYAPLASLPAIFKTSLDTIPADVPYVRADPARVERWRERLASAQGFKVGIVWAGTPLHQNDAARSSRLADFLPLAMEGVSLFALQKGRPEAQVQNPPSGMQITPLGHDLRNFADTAALLECLDLTISVDTSVVHVAGALARPVWTLLAKGPDWRWMLDRDDSPWYPTMKLFRQREMGNWSEVMQRVSANLREIAKLEPAMQSATDAHLAGVQELQQGRETALPLLEKAVALAPNTAQFHHDLGSALAMLGKHAEALGSLAEAIKLAPDEAWIRADAGMSLLALGEHEQGINEMYLAVQMAPDDPRLLVNFGMALGRFGAHEQAEQVLTHATQLAPTFALGWTLLADSLWQQGKYDEAFPAAQRAAQLAPDDAAAQMALGNASQQTARFDQAAASFRRAVALDPELFGAQHNLALTLWKMGSIDESIQVFDHILARLPDATEAKVDRAFALLTRGQYEQGFADYELRDQLPRFAERIDRSRQRWDGSDPAGKTIVIINDQGVGDLIQFIRYAPLLADRGAKIWVACPQILEPIALSVRGVIGIVDPQAPPLPDEMWVWEASLPALFKTTLENIPREVPYVHADAAKVARWREGLAGDPNLKVGLVWAGAAINDNDRARSCTLLDLAPLAMPGVTFYSLQKGPPAAQVGGPPAGMNLIDLAPELNDFGDTAALMECLDLVISVDTAAAHLAGALGRPVWALLYKGADWRYGVDRDDSPWYPTMRLFRQVELGHWSAPVAKMANELKEKVK